MTSAAPAFAGRHGLLFLRDGASLEARAAEGAPTPLSLARGMQQAGQGPWGTPGGGGEHPSPAKPPSRLLGGPALQARPAAEQAAYLAELRVELGL